MRSVRAAERRLRVFATLLSIIVISTSVRVAFAAQPGCGVDFSKIAAASRPGVIPGFTPFFTPVLSRSELERAAETLPVGTQIKKFVEHGYNTWSVEKLSVEGRPQVVTVKRSRAEGEARNETRILNLMSEVFEKGGIDQYFHVVRPYETGDYHTVFPLVEARDMRELAREATAKISTKKFRTPDDTGGPLPKGTDPNIDRLWTRFEEGIEFAVKALKKAGYSVERVKKKSMTTGEPYVDHIQVITPRGTAPRDVIGFTIRSSDILVTSDGRFVIVDPY